jgi:hypothetical protein
MEANAFGIIPKKPFQRRGWRMIKARSITGGGLASETAAIPDTDKPDLATASLTPKIIAHAFNASMVSILEGKSLDDTLGDPMEFLRSYFALEHRKHINEKLLTDYGTLAGNEFESIDRVCASSAETTALGYTAGDEDIYGIDRSANSWADAYVSHNSGTDRSLTLALINALIRNTRPYWSDPMGRNNVFLTGPDTFDDWNALLQAQQRFFGDAKIAPSVNGVQVVRPGVEGGFSVATYHGIPIIVSDDVPQDTKSRIYLLDLGYLSIEVMTPTQYFETGVSHGDPFSLNAFVDEGVFLTIGELKCTNFKAQGKIRDLA